MASACVASLASFVAPITHLVSVEVIEGPLSTLRMWTNVAVTWIEAVINVAAEIARAMEPRAGSDEHAVGEPLGTIVSIWSAVVWGELIVAIRTNRLWSDIDGDLGGCRARHDQRSGNQGGKSKNFPIAHKFLLIWRNATQMPKLQRLEESEFLRWLRIGPVYKMTTG
jgi:hypothetical protein